MTVRPLHHAERPVSFSASPTAGAVRAGARRALLRGVAPREVQLWLSKRLHHLVVRCASESVAVTVAPPEPMALFLTGSMARRQASLGSDVDYGIILHDGKPEARDWARALGRTFAARLHQSELEACEMYNAGAGESLIGSVQGLLKSAWSPLSLSQSRTAVGDPGLTRSLQRLATELLRASPVDIDSWGQAQHFPTVMPLLRQRRVELPVGLSHLRAARKLLQNPLQELALRKGLSSFDESKQLEQAAERGLLSEPLCAETSRALHQLSTAALHAELAVPVRTLLDRGFSGDLVERLRLAVNRACGGADDAFD